MRWSAIAWMLLFALPRERADAQAGPIYRASWWDTASVGAAGALFVLPTVLDMPNGPPTCAPYDPTTVPTVDRSALHTFSDGAGTASTALLAGVAGLTAFASLHGLPAAQWRGNFAMLANAAAWTAASTEWLKVVIRRKRPVLYTSGAAAAAADRESQQSFPSTHASPAFAAATSYLVRASRAATSGHMTRLPRVMSLSDVVLFNITAIVGLRWLTTAGRIGPASVALWVIAMVIFFLPSAMAVRELADIDPGEGGIYRWATRAFGPRHGFLAGWGYWVNNLVYYPSLLLTSGAIVAYVGGPGFVHLAENKWFIAAFSLGNLWIAVGLNLVGLRVGKWVQNLGAYGTWLPAAIFVLLALWSFATHGSATPFTARALVPTHVDLPLLSLFATMTFAFAGLELAPTLGDEIRDPVATLRRGILLSGIGVVAMYLLGTVAMLVALPAETVSVTNGMPQATAVLVERLGAAWLAPAAALVAALLTLGNLGGVGAWISGTARIPFVAGVDRVLPPAFGKVHPRWQTPYVALLVQGGIATVFVVAGLAGSTVRDAYLALVDTTIVLFFIPYLYLFAAYLRLRRERTPLGLAAGWAGLFAVLLSIGLAFVPAADVANPLAFEAKVVGGVVGFMGAGLVLLRRGVRERTASVGGAA